ncbi:MAG: HAMP domain-containing sensor histidine kinase [Lachnospiraceae bacterium]|nr:HAMP domain-containing sensor histidine kinase [Lachnospiraceae bacterium]
MNVNFIQLKKIIAAALHLAALGMVVVSIGILYSTSNYGRGLTWIQSETYVQSDLFYNQLQSDIRAIFDYAQLRDAFESEGELDMDKEILSINYGPNAAESYSMSDILKLGETYGYFIQDDWSINVINPADSDLQEEPVLVEYKAYDPDPDLKEPGQAYAKMKDLCYEVLTNFSRYCSVHYSLVTGSSNLTFQLTCRNDNEMISANEIYYTNATDPSWEKLKHRGLYAEISADDNRIDSNMLKLPVYLQSLASDTRFYEQTFQHFIISVDTNFPNSDVYTREAASYNSMRSWTIRGLVIMSAGLLLCILTLLYLAALSGHDGPDRAHIRLYPYDRISAEGCILMFLVIGAFCCYAGQVVGFRLLHLVISSANWYYAERLLLYVICYLVCLLCGFSLLRRYKAGRLWNGSWTQKALHDIHEYYTRESTSNSAAYSYVIFVALNITLACSTIYLLFDLDSSLHQILFGGLLLFWIVLDLAAFRYVIKKALQNDKIQQAIANIADGDISYCVNVDEFSGRQKITADHINHIGENLDGALQEKVKSERFKADLITNVSHDLKTPLTSIINYVDLIKREHIQNEKVQGYLEVLEQKSQRLKTLTEDLVEASKASSGNLKLEITDIDFVELVHQTNGEFEEKFAQRHLELVSRLPEQPILIEADGRRLWRVLENLYNNAFKYAMEHSRIYVDITREEDMVQFTIKNISEHPLNISSDELTERFVRGDVSRTTEGSGLGLSIAESLTQLQKGTFEIVIDGDLFKVYVKFPVKKTPDV